MPELTFKPRELWRRITMQSKLFIPKFIYLVFAVMDVRRDSTIVAQMNSATCLPWTDFIWEEDDKDPSCL